MRNNRREISVPAPVNRSNRMLIEHFICGGAGGFATVLVGHPFDTIKVRLQTMPEPKPGERPMYLGTLDCVMQTVKNEGPFAFYKGVTAPLATIIPTFAVSFMGYQMGHDIIENFLDEKRYGFYNYFIAGAFSGAFTSIVMSPSERIKCILQIQTASKEVAKYKGSLDALIQLFRAGGITSVYRGICATLLRDIPGSATYFLTYGVLKDFFTNHKEREMTLLETVFAGGCSGTSLWLVCMPFDVLKSRLQTAPDGTYPKGIRSVAKALLRTEGPSALYRGIVPILLRSFPANAACFVGFEGCKKLLLMFQ